MARILDGKIVAEAVYQSLRREISQLPKVPKIVFIRVGEDPASRTYVNAKAKKCQELGLLSDTVVLPETVTERELLEWIRKLNDTAAVNGILVQLPLPKSIDKYRVLEAIDPRKDVDGLHSVSAGRLMQGKAGFVPCTPAGIAEILRFHHIALAGAEVVVVGRSEIVGKPAALLCLQGDATVTVCHSRTRDLGAVTRRADILIVAAGKPRLIGADHVREGATVVDVGIHRVDGRLCGDVDFAAVEPKAGAITPVPGGVGPMTIAMLMKNLVAAARL